MLTPLDQDGRRAPLCNEMLPSITRLLAPANEKPFTPFPSAMQWMNSMSLDARLGTFKGQPLEKPLVPQFRATKPDRKSTRLNSSHSQISYAVFCLKKKKKRRRDTCSR